MKPWFVAIIILLYYIWDVILTQGNVKPITDNFYLLWECLSALFFTQRPLVNLSLCHFRYLISTLNVVVSSFQNMFFFNIFGLGNQKYSRTEERTKLLRYTNHQGDVFSRTVEEKWIWETLTHLQIAQFVLEYNSMK